MALVWLFPLLWAVYTSCGPYSDTTPRLRVAGPRASSLDNFINAWTQAELPHFYPQHAGHRRPGVILTLLLSSMVAFVLTRFSWPLQPRWC